MTAHAVPMPEHIRPWTCTCGATAPLPMRVTWDAWDASVAAHLAPADPRVPCPHCGALMLRRGLGQHLLHRHPELSTGGVADLAPPAHHQQTDPDPTRKGPT